MPPKAAGRRPAAPRRPTDGISASPTPGPSGTTATPSASQSNVPVDPQLQSQNAPSAASAPPSSSTGPRGPVQRLQTLKKRGPSGSLVPLNPDGTAPKPTLKYQPRAVGRRSKEQREALEKLEAERQRERESEIAAMRRTPGDRRGSRGRGRGRGRGGGFGMDVSGPLGSGASGASRGGGYGPRIKGEKGKSSWRRSGAHGVTKSQGNDGHGGISSDEGSDSGPRFSIEQINIGSDSEGENNYEGKGKTPARTPNAGNRGLRPIRVERYEHVERSMGVNTEGSSSKSAELRKKAKAKGDKGEESLFVQSDDEEGNTADVEMVDATGAPGTEGEPKIKEEPTDGDVSMRDDIPQATDEGPDSAPVKSPTRTRKKVAIKDPRAKLQTEEERQEYDRHEKDIEQLKKALGTMTTLGGEDTTATGDGEASGEQQGEVKDEIPKDERQGRLFLLQFPPMTPNLVVPQPAGKDENNTDTVEEVPPPPTTTTQPPTDPSAQEATSIPSIKKESDDTAQPSSAAPATDSIPTTTPLITATSNNLPPGRVGKLQIHRSGRATIDWGGISLELTKGSDVGFLQDAVVASEQKPLSTTSPRQVWAMSQVTGKFIVTPDWNKLLE